MLVQNKHRIGKWVSWLYHELASLTSVTESVSSVHHSFLMCRLSSLGYQGEGREERSRKMTAVCDRSQTCSVAYKGSSWLFEVLLALILTLRWQIFSSAAAPVPLGFVLFCLVLFPVPFRIILSNHWVSLLLSSEFLLPPVLVCVHSKFHWYYLIRGVEVCRAGEGAIWICRV